MVDEFPAPPPSGPARKKVSIYSADRILEGSGLFSNPFEDTPTISRRDLPRNVDSFRSSAGTPVTPRNRSQKLDLTGSPSSDIQLTRDDLEDILSPFRDERSSNHASSRMDRTSQGSSGYTYSFSAPRSSMQRSMDGHSRSRDGHSRSMDGHSKS